LKISVPGVFSLTFVAKQKESNFAKLLSGGIDVKKAMFVLIETCKFSLIYSFFLPKFKLCYSFLRGTATSSGFLKD
jgi:hypothetical protein